MRRQARTASFKARVIPVKPRGYENRAIDIDLSRWRSCRSRSGSAMVSGSKVGSGAALFLFFSSAFVLPGRFKRSLVLHYKDVRDPDLPRESAYPIGVKAKAGFYRSAQKLLLSATGPVRAGASIEARARAGRRRDCEGRWAGEKSKSCRGKMPRGSPASRAKCLSRMADSAAR